LHSPPAHNLGGVDHPGLTAEDESLALTGRS
jgi:hypothetical protein